MSTPSTPITASPAAYMGFSTLTGRYPALENFKGWILDRNGGKSKGLTMSIRSDGTFTLHARGHAAQSLPISTLTVVACLCNPDIFELRPGAGLRVNIPSKQRNYFNALGGVLIQLSEFGDGRIFYGLLAALQRQGATLKQEHVEIPLNMWEARLRERRRHSGAHWERMDNAAIGTAGVPGLPQDQAALQGQQQIYNDDGTVAADQYESHHHHITGPVAAPIVSYPIFADENARFRRLFGELFQEDINKEAQRHPVPFVDGSHLTAHGLLQDTTLNFRVRTASNLDGDTPDDWLAFLRDVYAWHHHKNPSLGFDRVAWHLQAAVEEADQMMLRARPWGRCNGAAQEYSPIEGLRTEAPQQQQQQQLQQQQQQQQQHGFPAQAGFNMGQTAPMMQSPIMSQPGGVPTGSTGQFGAQQRPLVQPASGERRF